MDNPLSVYKWATITVMSFILSVYCAKLFNDNSDLRMRSDLLIRWHAARLLFSEQRNIYDPRNGAEVDMLIFGRTNNETRLEFYYPAHLLILIAPLSLLDYSTAHFLWTTAGQLCFFFSMFIMMYMVGWPTSFIGTSLYLLISYLSYPMLLHTCWGQFNTIGIFALTATIYFLKNERYALAGITCLGLTLKPHPFILILTYLFLWIFFKPYRYRFYISFISGLSLCWLIAELMQPAWVNSFIASLSKYPPLVPAVETFGNPYYACTGFLLFLSSFFFWKHRHAPIMSPGFAGCITLSMAAWSLIFPFIITFHILGIAVIQIALLKSLKDSSKENYQRLIFTLIIICIFGWFDWNLDFLHSDNWVWNQSVFKVVYPTIITIAALYLCHQTPSSSKLEHE